MKSASQQLGIQYYTLVDWRRNRKTELNILNNALTEDELRRHVDELEQENAELRKANGGLKEVLALNFCCRDTG